MNIRARSLLAAALTAGLVFTGAAASASAAGAPPSPFGSFDDISVQVTVSDASIAVRGWAADPVEPTTSIPVHLYVTNPVGGRTVSVVQTTGRRADVAAAYAGLGSRHGFEADIAAPAAGTYRICAYAIATTRAIEDNPLLGCRSVVVSSTPIGSVDSAAITLVNGTPTLTVSGWAMDRAVPAQSTQVHVYVTDPRGRSVPTGVVADRSRPDIAAAFTGAGARHGFEVAVPIASGGTYRACSYAIGGSVFASSHSLIGCQSLTFGPSIPIGVLDSVKRDTASGTLAIDGWAMDAGMRAASTQVHVYVTSPDGRKVNHVIEATTSRADIARAFAGAGDKHGFSARIPAPQPGVYTVCAYPISAPVFGMGHSDLPCVRLTVASSGGNATVQVGSGAATVPASTGTPAIPVVIVTPPAAQVPPSSPPSTAVGTVVPSAANTGVIAGSKLTVVTGDIIVTKRGTVLQNLDVRGLIRVEAADVVIRNSVIRGRSVSSNSALIYAGSSAVSNLLIEDVELRPSTASPWINGVMGAEFTLRRANISGVVDSVHIFGDDVVVESSWLHDNLHYEKDPNWNGGPSHDDNVQVQKGTNIRIVGNSLSGAVNAAMQVTQDAGVTANLVFTRNWASGGACTINIAEKGRGVIRGLTVQDNSFGASRYNCPAIIDNGTTAVAKISGNSFSKGAFKIQPR